jgi:ABC-type sugar transport system ATPase subunit
MSLRLEGIVKSFGGVRALRGVDLEVEPGSIVGLVGGNGAGKSTLMKIAAGVVAPDQGEVTIGGRAPRGPADAIRLGVSLVRQELSQPLDLDVAANVMLGHEPHRRWVIDRRTLRRRAVEALARVQRNGDGIDPDAPLGLLSPAQRQRVEIARALSLDARILLLDEPTAALGDADAERLFTLLGELRGQGLGVVYISHRLEEVLRVTDRIVCLRDGRVVGERPTAQTTREALVMLLAGATSAAAPAAAPGAEVVLAVRGRISFELRAGEILGLTGLVGAGRSRLLRALFGGPGDLQVAVRGRPVTLRSPRQAVRAGLALVPEERASQGLLLDFSVERNIALPSLERLLLEDEGAIARPLMRRLGIPTGQMPAVLSGGNQQKVVLAKWMARRPAVLLLDEPTRGLDVAARREVHDLVRELAAAGCGVVVSSAEAEEIAALCHRALVLRRGQLGGELPREQLSEAHILELGA